MINPSLNRVTFDPSNIEHRGSYYTFLTTKRWGKVQFICEPQFSSVPEMVSYKFAIYELEKECGLITIDSN
jgi:hypothetical protein